MIPIKLDRDRAKQLLAFIGEQMEWQRAGPGLLPLKNSVGHA